MNGRNRSTSSIAASLIVLNFLATTGLPAQDRRGPLRPAQTAKSETPPEAPPASPDSSDRPWTPEAMTVGFSLVGATIGSLAGAGPSPTAEGAALGFGIGGYIAMAFTSVRMSRTSVVTLSTINGASLGYAWGMYNNGKKTMPSMNAVAADAGLAAAGGFATGFIIKSVVGGRYSERATPPVIGALAHLQLGPSARGVGAAWHSGWPSAVSSIERSPEVRPVDRDLTPRLVLAIAADTISGALEMISSGTYYAKVQNRTADTYRVFYKVSDGERIVQDETSMVVRSKSSNSNGPYHCSANARLVVTKVRKVE